MSNVVIHTHAANTDITLTMRPDGSTILEVDTPDYVWTNEYTAECLADAIRTYDRECKYYKAKEN